MRGRRGKGLEIAVIEQRFIPLYAEDINEARALKRRSKSRPKKASIPRIKTDGYYSGGRRVIAKSAEGIIISAFEKKTRNKKRSSPQDVLADEGHHRVLNEWMAKKTALLVKKAPETVELRGDFANGHTSKGNWFDTRRFGEVGIDEYLLLKKLAAEMGGYAILLENIDGLPPDRVSLIGVGEGNRKNSGLVFNDRADIAFTVFNALRFAGGSHGEAMARTVQIAANPGITYAQATAYAVAYRSPSIAA